jgi:chorismate mutase / prephenate dehydrogenase
MKQRALVVGGRGLMGQWFCSYLDSMGHEVVTVDPKGPTKGHRRAPSVSEGLDGLGAHDLVLVCTPMQHTAGALAEARLARTPALVADICSIKEPVLGELRRMSKLGMKVASLHPMWGPDTVLLSDKNLLVLDAGSRAAVRDAKGLFKGTAVKVHELPLARHDALMAWSLGLPHLLNLAFARVLAHSGLPPAELERLGGPTMVTQLKVARGVARENKDLYHSIQALNPHAPEVHKRLQGAMREFREATRSPEDFKALMAACEAYFDEAASQAPGPKRRSKA